MTITITSLKKEFLAETIQLCQQVFCNDDPAKIASTLENSLNPDKEAILKNRGGASIQYWVAKDNHRIVGSAGYYVMLEDIHEAAWLAWFFVDPLYRGKKIGLQLLEAVIDAVKKTGKHYLRVYSSKDDPLEKRAHQIYERRGFVTFREPSYNQFHKEIVIYLQLDLLDLKENHRSSIQPVLAEVD